MYVKKINKCRVPIKSWIPFQDIEHSTLEQLINCASLPTVLYSVVALPDVHFGMGIPIGTVIALDNTISVNAVGSDIGCGMSAIKTNILYHTLDKNTIYKIRDDIKRVIPTGYNKHSKNQKVLPVDDSTPVVLREYSNAMKSLGTLGGGNHFIEIQVDPVGHIWIMLHSGSRNVGKQVGEYYNALAKENSKLPSNWQLDVLHVDSKEGTDYLAEMKWCVNYALQNRKLMMDKVKDVFSTYFGGIEFDELINIAHNYAALETHFGNAVYVHRKGATSAREGEIGIIPGSMGSNSYIVRGKGNVDSFCSCSHGAGRTLGRNQAKKKLDLEEEQYILEDKGIIHELQQHSLDEATSAYKDITTVMLNQEELVDIVVELEPITTIKDMKKRKR